MSEDATRPRPKRDMSRRDLERAAARNKLTVAVFGIHDPSTSELTAWIPTRRRTRFDFRATLAAALHRRDDRAPM